jgi:membrane fusion protein, heavy metal efflux system
VLTGVAAGERVVSDGAYLVRLAATGGDEIGHGHAH